MTTQNKTLQKQMMKILESNPRIKLSKMSEKLGIPISTLHDNMGYIMREHNFSGAFVFTGSVL